MSDVVKATVTHYREGKDANGEIVVMYIITVQAGPNSSEFSISKRYSDFAAIYNVFKDALPNDYKFPKKSMFNNSAAFTKERRLKGFQELLALLLKYHPGQDKVKEFLRFNPKPTDAPSQSGVLQSAKELRHYSVQNESRDTSNTSQVMLRRKLAALTDHLTALQADYSTIVSKSAGDESDERNGELLEDLKKSAAISAGMYSVLVALNIVDVSHTTYSRMLLTVAAIAMLLTYMSLIDRQRAAS